MSKAGFGSVMVILLYLATFLPFALFMILGPIFKYWHKILSVRSNRMANLLERKIHCPWSYVQFLSMSSSFSFASFYLTRYEQQQVGLHWDNIWESPIEDDDTNFATALIFIAVDTVAYFCIGALIITVQRKRIGDGGGCDGAGRPVLAPWRKGAAFAHGVEEATTAAGDEDMSGTRGIRMEGMKRVRVGVSLKGLTKIYESRKVKRKVAVDSLTMDFNVGEVTCLLGHNGAGKSTTMYAKRPIKTIPFSSDVFQKNADRT